MYSYQKTIGEPVLWYDILDPDGDIICQVVSKGEAIAVVSHLNKG